MKPKFGTSGLRGLVTDLTTDCVQSYTRAFLEACETNGVVHVGWDLRPSSPEIALAVVAAVRAQGQEVRLAGVLPTPALALAASQAGEAAIMITGSHIPADRNGLKFYTTTGEISKADETAILDCLVTAPAAAPVPVSSLRAETMARDAYMARYVSAFGSEALAGLTIGVYQHSSVARDVLVTVLRALGATPVPLERTAQFVPVDTEAVDAGTRRKFTDWCGAHRLDALVSTDGDADRPMVTDHTGRVVPGDVLGVLTARVLGARVLCTPVSSNSMITQMEEFSAIHLTRIGSPYVIAAMEEVLAETPAAEVAGFEANGGFLLGFAAQGPAGSIPPLMTRDCLLPILSALYAARVSQAPLAEVVADLPQRFTAADRLTEVDPDLARNLIQALAGDAAARAGFFQAVGPICGLDVTDGLRVRFETGDIVHLRPSGNAPELRCYAEAQDPGRATSLVAAHLDRFQAVLRDPALL